MSKRYEEEVARFVKAIDIANEALINYPPPYFSADNLATFIKFHNDLKERALNPLPQYRNLATHKHRIVELFTRFNEGSGLDVEYFWQQIAAQDLRYKRENKLPKILKRDKIKNDIEYQYVTDVIVPMEQEGLITKEQAKRLSELIGLYEGRKSR